MPEDLPCSKCDIPSEMAKEDTENKPFPHNDKSPKRDQEVKGLPTPSGAWLFAGAAAAAGAIPIPLLDVWVGSMVRGALMRRVAARRGVQLHHEARAILAQVASSAWAGQGQVRFVKALLTKLFPPLQPLAQLEELIAAWMGALLFDHYLSTSDRASVSDPLFIGSAEAMRIKFAIENSLSGSGGEILRSFAKAFAETLVRSFAQLRSADPEDRNAFERVLDTLLDGIADWPMDAWAQLSMRFDEAIAKAEGKSLD
ncbi:MAG: hypothetical protein NZM37_11095 [Sandaracinaceae bacterium]|nr:hypothetical protein [Sandaracinaceae bacterium]